uniref:Uncharacterized protein n=1 Tax=Davidia involucrata TaxID=16924 RepID=A0A5B7BKJ4_DAVIN
MRSQFSISNEDENESARSAFCWWRRAEEFKENGDLKVDISGLTPRLSPQRDGKAALGGPRRARTPPPQAPHLPSRRFLAACWWSQKGRHGYTSINHHSPGGSLWFWRDLSCKI